MSAVDDVFLYLEDQGLAGGSTEWDLLRRRLTDTPATDKLVVVTEDGGPEPELSESAGIGDSALQDVGVQVLIRAGAYDGDASFDKAFAIHTALHALFNTEVGSTTYLRARAVTPEPIFMGFDDQGRPRHTISFRLLAEQ